MNLKLSQQAVVIASVPLTFELLLLGVIGYILNVEKAESFEEDRARTVIAECSVLSSNAVKHAALLFGGLSGGMDANRLNELLHKSSDVLEDNRQSLRQVVTDRSQIETFTSIENSVRNIRALWKSSASPGDTLALSTRARRLKPMVLQLDSSLQQLMERERSSLDKSHKHNQLLQGLLEVTCWSAFAVSILVAFALLVYFRNSITARFETLKQNSERLASGELLLPALTGSDEFVELDSAFRSMASNLQQATAQRKELVQMVAHDLRSPLSSMLLTLQIMETGMRGEMSPKLTEDVTLLTKSAERLVRLIGDLLSAEALEAGELNFEKKRSSLPWLISRAVEEVQSLAVSKNISINVPEGESPTVFVDGERIAQVLVNLLSNAIKFSPPNSKIIITCTNRMSVGASKMTEVSIIDEGRGVPDDKIARLFQRFSQAEADDRKHGSGLGLAICKALVTAHGGSIGCENNKKAGSRFWFQLPLAAE